MASPVSEQVAVGQAPNANIRPRFGIWLPDLLVGVSLAVLVAVACFHTGRMVDPTLFGESGIWFDAHNGRVYSNITDRSSNHYRANVRPLFSLLFHPRCMPHGTCSTACLD